ncbi:MAG: sporulation protein YqfD, partial [Ruminococcus sp.]|nr:sporulation protein YqfD [Candidatus Apopatosoma intestinale]
MREGTVFVRIPARYRKTLAAVPPEWETAETHALFSDLARYRHRFGLFFGAGLAVLLSLYLSRLVWDIRVEGCETVTEEQVIATLESHGFSVGTYIPSVDKERIALEILTEDGKTYSWFKINMRGTVAVIDLRERAGKDGIEQTGGVSNLIASRDGQITLLDVRGGAVAVKPGQIVEAGDLLVSGIIDSNAIGYRAVRARGSVYAKTTLFYTTEIPLCTEEKRTVETKTVEKSVKIFSKTLNLLKKTGEIGENYDIMETTKRLRALGVPLPLRFTVKEAVYYESAPITRTEEECLRLAREALIPLHAPDLDNAEILARYETIEITDGTLILHEQVECILDIAKEVPVATADRLTADRLTADR